MILIVAYIALIVILKFKFDLSDNKAEEERTESTTKDTILATKDYGLNTKD